MNPQQEVWYRYYDTMYGSSNEFGESTGPGRVAVQLMELPVLKHTLKGVWVGYDGVWKRLVLTGARKRYACPTKKEALESFIKRKERQRSILNAQLDRTCKALDIARTGRQTDLCSVPVWDPFS